MPAVHSGAYRAPAHALLRAARTAAPDCQPKIASRRPRGSLITAVRRAQAPPRPPATAGHFLHDLGRLGRVPLAGEPGIGTPRLPGRAAPFPMASSKPARTEVRRHLCPGEPADPDSA